MLARTSSASASLEASSQHDKGLGSPSKHRVVLAVRGGQLSGWSCCGSCRYQLGRARNVGWQSAPRLPAGDAIMEGCRASCRALSPQLQVSRARLVKLGNLAAIKALIIGAVDDFLRWFHAVEGRGNL